MGRSRGGLTTKIHALVDADGLPIALKLTEGQAHDGRAAWDMLGSLAAGNILLADRAYDSDVLRQTLAERGAWANVKPMPNRRNVPAFSSFTATATSSNASLTSSNTSEPSQPDTTKRPKTTSHPSSLPQQESGCELMSR
jgi:Transposase DDE domain